MRTRQKLKIYFATASSAVALVWVVNIAWPGDLLIIAEPLIVSSPFRYEQDRVNRRETLSHVFARHNVIGAELVQLLEEAEGLNPRRTRVGMAFDFRFLIGDTVPNRVAFRVSENRFTRLDRDVDGVWRGSRVPINWSISRERVQGTINSSLWLAVEAAIDDSVLPSRERRKLIVGLADDIFGWQIDFTRDVREGDDFRLLFERLESSEGDVRFGRVLAAKVETQGRENSAYVLPDEQGRNSYYDVNRRSLRRAFLRSPISYGRFSSNFSRSRFHPILRVRRPHLGLDIAASSGAPIRATADGVVRTAGRDRGYGLLVTIDHAADTETRYAHMRRIARGIRVGTRVVQGQTIGYVGMTGLATAPHVHYELLKNGRHLNPRSRISLGDGTPVPAALRGEFERVMREFDIGLEGGELAIETSM